jgi:hypothetical protein
MGSVSTIALSCPVTASAYGNAIDISRAGQAEVAIIVAGASYPVGSVELQVSNTAAADSWETRANSVVRVSGNGLYAIDPRHIGYRFCRVVYVAVSGSGGQLDATLTTYAEDDPSITESLGDVIGNGHKTVIGLQSWPVIDEQPDYGDVLTWDGVRWRPLPSSGSGTDSNIFTASSDDALLVGMWVAAGGVDVVRADANDTDRLPAIGVVTSVNLDGTYDVRVGGVASGMPGAFTSRTLYLGTTGYAVQTAAGLSNVQALGVWLGNGKINVNAAPQYIVRN